MRRCLTCEGLLSEKDFSRGSPICKVCVEKLREVYAVEYSPPERTTVKEASVRLILAIMGQAKHDEESGEWSDIDRRLGGPLASWRHYWVDDPAWNRIWEIMLDTESSDATIRSTFAVRRRG